MNDQTAISIFWFRRDLRLDDNAGLYHALKSSYPVLQVFIFDKDILDKLDEKQDRRVAFIHSAVSNIKQQLEGKGSSLLILYDTPAKAFEALCSTYEVKAVYTNHDYEPYAIKRDKEVAMYLKEQGIDFFTFKDQVIFERDEILKKDGTPYTVFTPYSKVWKQQLTPFYYKAYPVEKYLNNLFQTKPLKLPALNKLGFEEVAAPASTRSFQLVLLNSTIRPATILLYRAPRN